MSQAWVWLDIASRCPSFRANRMRTVSSPRSSTRIAPLLRNGDPRSTCAFATRWAAPSTMSRHNNGIQRTICASETNTLLSVKRSNGKLIDLR